MGCRDYHARVAQQRLFTREEAQELLPELARLLERAQSLLQTLESVGENLASHFERRNGHVPARPQRSLPAPRRSSESNRQELRTILERIHSLGVVVRDVRAGLIDFPALRAGRVVYLCWKTGEPLSLAWWHDLEAGFAGRQPLD